MACHSNKHTRGFAASFAGLGVLVAVLLLGLSSVAATSAKAAGFCVACSQPNAIYECVLPREIAGVDQPLALRGMRMACIQGIAKSRNHGQCSVRKGVRGACIGERVLLSDIVETEALRVQAQQAREKGEPVPPEAAASAEAEKARERGEPKTLVELTERTVEVTEKQIEKVGKTLEDAGGAATSFMRRSWTCVTSLFADCGS
jgi:hypothetical protein